MRKDPAVALRQVIDRVRESQLPAIPEKVRFEMRRKVLHVVVAIVAVPTVLLLPFFVAAGIALLGIVVVSLTWAIERRRMPDTLKGPLHDELADVLERTRRQGEDFPWSPVLYTASLILIGLAHEYLGLSASLAFAAYAILGIGDAASALVGVAYGRVRLAWNRRKSVEGTLAGAVAGFLAGAVMATVPYVVAGLVVPPTLYLVVLAGAVAGALAETLPRVEDNFVVPLASALVMFAAAGAIGLPLP